MIHTFINEFFPLNEFDIITLAVGLIVGSILWLWSKHTNSDQLRSYSPTLWTSLGIFFTFVSIFTSLKSYTPNTENGTFDIQDMIDKIIPAFSTSIIGIFGAVISTIINKISIANAERKENIQFQRLIKKKVGDNSETDTPDLMLLEIVSSIRESGINTCSKLETNHSNSDRKIDDLYNKILTCGFTKTNETLVLQQEELSKVVNHFLEKYISTNKEQQDSITAKFDNLQQMLADKIDYLITKNSDTILKLIDVHKDNVKLIADHLIKESQERNSELKEFIDKEETLIEEFISKADMLFDARINKESELFNTEIRETIEEFAKHQHELCASTISDCNNELATKSLKAIENQTEVNNKFIEDLQSSLTTTCDSLTNSVKDMSDRMAAKLDEIHEKEVSIIDKTVEHNQEQVDHILGIYRNYMNDLTSEIATCATQITEKNIEFINNSKDALDSQKETNNNFLANCKNSLSDFSSLISSSLTELSNHLIYKLEEIQQKESELVEYVISDNKQNVGLLLNANKDSIEKIATSIKTDNEDLRTHLIDSQEQLKKSALSIEKEYLNNVIRIKTDAKNDLSDIQATIISIQQTLSSSLEFIKTEIINATFAFTAEQNKLKEDIIKNCELLSGDITKKIHESSRIKDLEDASIKLTSNIKHCMEDLREKMQIITDKLDDTATHIQNSTTYYNNVLDKTDTLNEYIEKTKDLFKEHSTAIIILESSLSNIEKSIKRVGEQFTRSSNINNESQSKNSKKL